MAEYRCLKHDRVFEAQTDIRKPGSLASTHPETGKPDGRLAAHPFNGHPDCPKCAEELKTGIDVNTGKKMEKPVASEPVLNRPTPGRAPTSVVDTVPETGSQYDFTNQHRPAVNARGRTIG